MLEKLKKYWKETVAELRKMSWPTRQELTGSTIVVVVVSLVVAVFIGIVDRILVTIVKAIFGVGAGG